MDGQPADARTAAARPHRLPHLRPRPARPGPPRPALPRRPGPGHDPRPRPSSRLVRIMF